MAGLYEELNNDEKAIEYYNEVIRLVKQSGDSSEENGDLGCYTDLAKIYFNRNELPEAKRCLAKIHSFMPDSVQAFTASDSYRLSAQIEAKERQPDSAFVYFKEALKYYSLQSRMHGDFIADVCVDLATLELHTGDIPIARLYADQAIELQMKAITKARWLKRYGVWRNIMTKKGIRQMHMQLLRERSF